jgi:hypothetical protein
MPANRNTAPPKRYECVSVIGMDDMESDSSDTVGGNLRRHA